MNIPYGKDGSPFYVAGNALGRKSREGEYLKLEGKEWVLGKEEKIGGEIVERLLP